MDAKLTRRSAIRSAGAAFAIPANHFFPIDTESGWMPFTPKFIDMVRNVASVTGTDPVTLGPAVSGFTSLASVVTAGEQLYYCIQGVDKPAEREIGRGTMQADGKVARQAIAGALTNFTGGSKTIALVAAAEWFATLDQLAGVAAASVASRAELAARPAGATGAVLLMEVGREGLFQFDASNLSATVVADSAQGIYVAPQSDPSGAGGAWVRKFSGPVDPSWFGLSTANNGTANDAAMAATFAALKARSASVGTFSRAVEAIRFPAGLFNFSSTIELTEGTWTLEGVGTSDDAGTALKFPTGVTGIRVQRHNTEGASATRSPTGKGGQRSIIRNLVLDGAYTNAEAEAHGVQLRASAYLENLTISDFEGDAVYIAATAGGAQEGNANGFRLDNLRLIRCRDGVNIGDGGATADVNAGLIIKCDASANRRWGFSDKSFLGNTYVATHSANNGVSTGGSPSACVSHGGNRYAVKAGQEAGASTNAPSGTAIDNIWWYHIGSGGVHANFPAWTSGATYRPGGAFFSNNVNADNMLLGCYTEGGQGPAQASRPTMILGGTQGAGVEGGAVWIRATTQSGTFTSDGIRIGGPAAPYLDLIPGGFDINDTYQLMPQGNDIAWTVNNSGLQSVWAFRLTGEATTASVGKRRMDFPNGFGLADKKVMSGTAAPTSGTFVQGDMMFNAAPTAGAPMGWMCVASGSPGTWKAMAALAA